MRWHLFRGPRDHAIGRGHGPFFRRPLFITALSGPLLGERVGWRRWLAVAIGMLGVLIMVRPSGAAVQHVAILPLISALGYAGTQLMTRRLGVTDGA